MKFFKAINRHNNATFYVKWLVNLWDKKAKDLNMSRLLT